MSTSCGGSGRGGGVPHDVLLGVGQRSRGTSRPLSSPTPGLDDTAVNPTLVVYDSHGNELYNQAIAGVVNGTQV